MIKSELTEKQIEFVQWMSRHCVDNTQEIAKLVFNKGREANIVQDQADEFSYFSKYLALLFITYLDNCFRPGSDEEITKDSILLLKSLVARVFDSTIDSYMFNRFGDQIKEFTQ